jgi:hypothetical protein
MIVAELGARHVRVERIALCADQKARHAGLRARLALLGEVYVRSDRRGVGQHEFPRRAYSALFEAALLHARDGAAGSREDD